MPATPSSHPQRGCIYWVRLPGKPREASRRPALVLSLDARNRLANDVIVVPLSSTLRPAPTHVLLRKGEGGLRRDSVAKCEQITTLETSLLGKKLGSRLAPPRMIQVEKAVLRAIGVPVA